MKNATVAPWISTETSSSERPVPVHVRARLRERELDEKQEHVEEAEQVRPLVDDRVEPERVGRSPTRCSSHVPPLVSRTPSLGSGAFRAEEQTSPAVLHDEDHHEHEDDRVLRAPDR